MGGAWAIHRRLLSGGSGLKGSPTIRWTTVRALGLQLPETAAVRSKVAGSNSGLGSTRMPRKRRKGCVHGAAQHAHFVHGGSLDVGGSPP